MFRSSRRNRASLLACILVSCWMAAGCVVAKTPSLKACLRNAANGGGPLPTVVYSDAHGLWGGSTISLGADGAYRHDLVDPRGPPQRTEVVVDAARHRALVGLLLELEVWKQRVPERRAVPDESRASLVIRCGGQQARIWEWYNAMGELRRIARVRDALRALEQSRPAS
jgi:hypothetical protein